jgi:hypothetical protein
MIDYSQNESDYPSPHTDHEFKKVKPVHVVKNKSRSWLNCPCGDTATITHHDETAEVYEHYSANCMSCFGIHVEGLSERETRDRWNLKVKTFEG